MFFKPPTKYGQNTFICQLVFLMEGRRATRILPKMSKVASRSCRSGQNVVWRTLQHHHTHPDLVAEVFKKEAVYSKGGFRLTVPCGYWPNLFGHNIIDSHGDAWKSFMGIMKPGIRDKPVDLRPAQRKATKFISLLLEDQRMRHVCQALRTDGFLYRQALALSSAHFCHVCNPRESISPSVRMPESS
jgi:hypothetical protein